MFFGLFPIAFETTLAEGNRLEKRIFHTTFGLVS
jgi:hypothetical protein